MVTLDAINSKIAKLQKQAATIAEKQYAAANFVLQTAQARNHV